MRIEIRDESVLLDGYVNAVGRDSRPVNTPVGRVVEQIAPGTFQKALERADNIDLLVNHDKGRKIGSTDEGNLNLFEDSIGLRAICVVTDPEIIDKAKRNLLKGWSFGMFANDESIEERSENLPRRIITDLDLFEVSIVDERMNPCYDGTSIEQRAEEDVEVERRSAAFKAVTENMVGTPKETIDYSDLEKRLNSLKGENVE